MQPVLVYITKKQFGNDSNENILIIVLYRPLIHKDTLYEAMQDRGIVNNKYSIINNTNFAPWGQFLTHYKVFFRDKKTRNEKDDLL